VKADVKGFAETNLSVITADGQLFSFLVSYAENPLELNITIAGDQGASTLNNASSVTLTDNAARIRSKRGNIHSVQDKNSKVSLALKGFYVKGNTIFCKLHMENDSRIDYDIDQFHFYIRDRKKARRTASQEVKITPISIIGDTGTIQSKAFRTMIVAMPKFTIPDGKVVVVEMTEQSGGRHLYLHARNRHLMKARRI